MEKPGFARCPECGNLAMNPLPTCPTCGEREWIEAAARAEEAAGDPDITVGVESAPPAPSPDQIRDLASRMLDMLERVEWVRASGGKNYICPFCSGVSERSGGPGHQDDCEGEMVRREGNELRMVGGLR